MNTKGKAKRLLAVLLTAVMATALFAGCGGSSSKSSGSAAESTGESTSAQSGEEAPAESSGLGNVLRYGVTGLEYKFTSIMSSTVYDSYVSEMVFEKLITHSAQGVYENTSLCTYELSDDHLTYTFTLTDGVKFSDGTPMTSADVEFTYKTIAHPDYDGPRASSVAGMVGYKEFHSGATDVFEGIKVIDDKTISFTFVDAGPANVTSFDYGILPKHYYEFENWEQFLALIDKPLGSGPMVLESYEPKQFVDLVKNENYWDTSKTISIDGVMISDIPDESLLGALQTGQIDFYQQSNANPNTLKAIQETPGAKAHTFVGNGYTYMQFNTTRPTLNDKRVRQALLYALDRKSFIEAEYGPELAKVGLAPFSPLSWATPDNSELNAYEFDMAKAEALMTEAGWTKGSDGILEKDGQKMSLTWLVYTESSWPQTLSSMAADTWKQLGVDLKIDLLDFPTVVSRTMDPAPGEKDFDVYTMGFSVDPEPDPAGGLFDADQNTAGGFNASGYKNDRAQELIKLGRGEFDQAKRQEYYFEFAKLMNDEVPTTVMANRSELWAISDRVQGLEGMGPFFRWTRCLFDVTLS